MNEPGLIDETTLRKSLRLEPDERAPRFDVASIAALARQGSGLERRAVVTSLVACVIVGLAAAGVWSLIAALAPDLVDAAARAALDLVVQLAALLVPIAQLAAEPVVPFSLLAALGVAILGELRERRERVHARSS